MRPKGGTDLFVVWHRGRDRGRLVRGDQFAQKLQEARVPVCGGCLADAVEEHVQKVEPQRWRQEWRVILVDGVDQALQQEEHLAARPHGRERHGA